jgi:hypothetical protein
MAALVLAVLAAQLAAKLLDWTSAFRTSNERGGRLSFVPSAAAIPRTKALQENLAAEI